MLAPEKVTVNGRDYTVNPFTPMEAFEFYHGRDNAILTGKSLLPFGIKAIGQCVDPMMRSLGEPKHFKKCFSEHPEDMLPLQNAATKALIRPFEMKSDDTGNSEAS